MRMERRAHGDPGSRRFHLIKHMAEVLLAFLQEHRSTIDALFTSSSVEPAPDTIAAQPNPILSTMPLPPQPNPPRVQAAQEAAQERRAQRYARVHELHAQG